MPFPIRRVYWIYDVPGGARARRARLSRTLQEVFVALSGSFDLIVDDGRGSTVRQTLNRSYYGVYVPAMIVARAGELLHQRRLHDLRLQHYDEADYVRDYDEFRAMQGAR